MSEREGNLKTEDPSAEDLRRQASVVLAAIREARDDEARVTILLAYYSRARQDTMDEIVRRMKEATC